MSMKLRNLKQWKQIPAGEFLDLPGKRRLVKLEVNVEAPTRFDVEQDGVPVLLAVVEPWQCPLVMQFAVDGDCTVVPTTAGEVWYFTDDGQFVNYAVTTQSFTKLEQRMEMTPELEVTILKASLRKEQRLREQAELMLLKQQREEAAAANADPETGEVYEGEVPADPDTGTAEPETVAADSAASE